MSVRITHSFTDMLLGPDVLPWQMRWQGRPAITPPDTVWDRSMAIPMVAPAPSGASDDKRKHAQEPPQERTEDTVENTDTGRATPDDITVDIRPPSPYAPPMTPSARSRRRSW